MLAVAGLGSVMSSTGVVAIFIPVVLGIANRMKVSPRRLLMPLAFAGLISGMLTLVATPPNLVVNSELRRAGLEGFAFFDFTPIGLAILALGIGYMLLARRWLGSDKHGPAVEPRHTWPISREITGSTSASDACACCPARSWPIRHWTPCGCAASTAST